MNSVGPVGRGGDVGGYQERNRSKVFRGILIHRAKREKDKERQKGRE